MTEPDIFIAVGYGVACFLALLALVVIFLLRGR